MRLLSYGGSITLLASFWLKMAVFPKWLPWVLLLAFCVHLITGLLETCPYRKITLKQADSLANLTTTSFFIALTIGLSDSLSVFAGSIMVVAGILSNQIVMWANGMKMPVKDDDPELEVAEQHTYMDKNTHLSWFGDRIPFFRALVSIGDIFFVSGIWLTAVGLWLI